MQISDELFCLHSSTISAFWHDWLSGLTMNRNGVRYKSFTIQLYNVSYWESYNTTVQCQNTNYWELKRVNLTISAVVISCTGSSIILQQDNLRVYKQNNCFKRNQPLFLGKQTSGFTITLSLQTYAFFTTNQYFIVSCIRLDYLQRIWWKFGAKNLM